MLYDRMEVMIRGGMKLSVCVLQMDVVPGKAGMCDEWKFHRKFNWDRLFSGLPDNWPVIVIFYMEKGKLYCPHSSWQCFWEPAAAMDACAFFVCDGV